MNYAYVSKAGKDRDDMKRFARFAFVCIILLVTVCAATREQPSAHQAAISASGCGHIGCPVNQHWLVIPHVTRDNLQANLESLNAKGFKVTSDNWELVDEEFVLHVSDQDRPDEAQNQHWLVIPHVSQDNLQKELEKLNKRGYQVTSENWLLVGKEFVLFVCDNQEGEEQ